MEILDRPVTKNDILKLAMIDPMVNRVVKMHQKQGISWEEAIMTAVYYLVIRKNELFEEVMRLTPYQPPQIVIQDQNEGGL